MTTKPPIDFARSNRTGSAIASFLNRRARDRSVGAVDAALALDGLHAVAASLAVVDVLTGISRHRLGCAVTAFWTRNDGLQFHWTPPHWIRRSGRSVPVVTPDASDQCPRQRLIRSTRRDGNVVWVAFNDGAVTRCARPQKDRATQRNGTDRPMN